MVVLARIAASALAILALLLFACGLVGYGFDEPQGADFMISAATMGFVAGASRLAIAGRPGDLSRRGRLVAAVAIWITVPLALALPLGIAAKLGPVDAVFLATSAVTTTGATLFANPDQLPRSIVFALCLTSWYGGALTLMTAVAVLSPSGAGGLVERPRWMGRGTSTDAGEVLADTAREVLPIYGAATLMCIAALSVAGLPPFDATCLALSALSTGGFMPRAGGIAVYDSRMVELVLVVFMLAGATSIVWQHQLVERRWAAALQRRENFVLIAIVIGLGLAAAAVLVRAGEPNAVTRGLFVAASLVSTTGFETSPGGFGRFPVAVILLVILIGGATFSTAGGMKLYRVGGMLVQSGRELNRLIYPHGIRPARIGGEPYDIQRMKAIWTAFALWVGAIFLVTVAVAATHRDFAGAYVATLAALTNTGQVYPGGLAGGVAWPGWAALAPSAKLVAAVAMVAGRLELVALLAFVNLAFWRR
ncbi:MAG: TrkH family potassium uptake protein [Xanthobacteraceae bacterium]|nr:TrkH family potassium uptake protein [Xanthobacteraceae bacterium]